MPLGFRITEVDAAGSVPELLAYNPLDVDGAPVRRRGTARREAEPDTERDGARRCSERDAHSGLVCRGGTLACTERQVRRCRARRLP